MAHVWKEPYGFRRRTTFPRQSQTTIVVSTGRVSSGSLMEIPYLGLTGKTVKPDVTGERVEEAGS